MVFFHATAGLVHPKCRDQMRWPGPEKIIIVFGHEVIGSKPHENQNQPQQANGKEEETIKAEQDLLYGTLFGNYGFNRVFEDYRR